MSNSGPDFNRLITTLNYQEPDCVPLAEAVISYKTMSDFLGKPVTHSDLASQVEFWAKAGYDYIALTVDLLDLNRVAPGSALAEYIKAKERETLGNPSLEKALIQDEDDLVKFPWEEVNKLNFSRFYDVQKYLPEGMKIIARCGKIFTLASELLGFNNFCINLIENPDFVKNTIEQVAKIHYGALDKLGNIPNIGAVWALDDIAFERGTLISPKELRKHIFPYYKEFGQICHNHKFYFFFHTDGMLSEVLEDFIAMGVDALHPIDPTCMNIEEVKQKVEGRLTLIGNVSNDSLSNGTTEEIRTQVKHLLQFVAPGGGYIMGSGNSIPKWTKIENYQAMLSITQEFGKYPIHIGDK